ncbi:hypothetical protein [Paenibacillus cymbidii]|uniref:hypothetical protein n=1 Tax=Paenibacillus cymbidii TaxID=1639034 RepID=UPI00108012CC|nr:hypothetical protein [Paenibacillus cymbidii]
MDQWTTFLQDKWYVLIVALVVIVLVVKLVKTVVKWVIILVLLAALAIYGYNYKDKLADVVQDAVSTISVAAQDQLTKAIKDEVKEAKYVKNADGSYTVKSKTVQIDGKPGSNDVKLTIAGQSFTIKADEALQKFIDQAKQNS